MFSKKKSDPQKEKKAKELGKAIQLIISEEKKTKQLQEKIQKEIQRIQKISDVSYLLTILKVAIKKKDYTRRIQEAIIERMAELGLLIGNNINEVEKITGIKITDKLKNRFMQKKIGNNGNANNKTDVNDP
jgi:hypothetical protein